MSNIRIKDLPTLNRALATGDVLAIDSGSGSAKVDFSTLKQQVNNVTLVSKTITVNGVYDPASDDAYGYSTVTVDVTSGALVGTTDPDSSMGNDGDYYYKRALITDAQGFPQNVTNQSQQAQAGYEFTAKKNCSVVGLYGRMSGTGVVNLYLYASNGSIIAEIDNVSITAGNTWVLARLSTPVFLTSGQNYVVMVKKVNTSASLEYGGATPSTAVTDSRIKYVRGKYGNASAAFPFSNDTNYRYSADVAIGPPFENVYEVTAQYYKHSGEWVAIA